jgi:hypothetical protein
MHDLTPPDRGASRQRRRMILATQSVKWHERRLIGTASARREKTRPRMPVTGTGWFAIVLGGGGGGVGRHLGRVRP